MNSQIKASERRRLASVNVNGSPSPVSATSRADKLASPSAQSSSGGESPPKKTAPASTPIRTTRTSRLRAAAAGGASSPSSESAQESPTRPRLKATPVRRPAPHDYPDSSSSSREGTPFTKKVMVKVEEKDKSSKRKSNLNRGLPSEKTGVLSSGDSTTDEGTYMGRLRPAASPMRSSQSAPRSLRRSNPPTNAPLASKRQSVSEEPRPADLSKQVDKLLARTKEYEVRLDNLAASRRPLLPGSGRRGASKENDIIKVPKQASGVPEKGPKKVLGPNNSSILKRHDPEGAPSPPRAPHSILKRPDDAAEPEDKGPAPILKKSSGPDDEPARPILKKRPSTDDESHPDGPKPILKVRSNNDSNNSSTTTSPSRRSPEHAPSQSLPRASFSDEPARPTESASEEETIRPSVSERAQLFMRLQELHKSSEQTLPPRSQVGPDGDEVPPTVIVRRNRTRRFATQPVTTEEVDEANSQVSNTPELPEPSATPNTTGDSDDEDEPANFSLAEKLRLFTAKIEHQRQRPAANGGERRATRRQVTSTRFRTVTGAEMSPLIAAFAKQPPPALLDGLSLRASREAVYEHAAQNFNLGARASLPELAEAEPRPRGILKHGSLPESNSDETDIVRGILKIPASVVATALASQAPLSTTPVNSVKSALKRDEPQQEKTTSSPVRGILKSSLTATASGSSSSSEAEEVQDDLAAALCKVAAQAASATHSQQVSSDTEGDTSSSGGREITDIILGARDYKPSTVATATLSAAAPHAAAAVMPEEMAMLSEAEADSWATAPPTPNIEAQPKPAPPPAAPPASCSPAKKEITTKMSIAERLAALKQSGESEWKKRVPRAAPLDEIAATAASEDTVAAAANYKPLQQSKSMPGSAKGILAEKLNLLDVASKDWKKRVGPKDAIEFSVAGRMGVTLEVEATPSPLASTAREKKAPKPARFKSKKERDNRTLSKESDSSSSAPDSPVKEAKTLSRSISAPETAPHVTEVPSFSDHLDQFFGAGADRLSGEALLESLPEQQQHTLLVSHKKTVQVQRRRNATRNPLRTLAARTDIVQHYQEVRTGAADRELKRLNVEKLAKTSNLAVEALAGLASKEDFTAVALKKATDEPVGRLLPFRDLMLLQVKGRRHVQTRLLEPVASRVNQGDSYVLVTPTAVYNWLGKFSNVIERTRSAEIALLISQRKDLGCLKAHGQVNTIDEAKNLGSSTHRRTFWKLLGAEDGNGQAVKAGHPDEDEEYENLISETNQMWSVEGNELVPVDKYWGSIPRIEMLDPNKVLVFDFGSEVYLWNGKNASAEVRRFAAEFVEDELWPEVDYSDCDISPIGEPGPVPRPAWAILGKLSQHMETTLFREKFLDWPDFSRMARPKAQNGGADGSIDVASCDAKKMAEAPFEEPDFELETSHIGRGEHYFDLETRRHFEIETKGVSAWHVEEFEHQALDESSLGQFHHGDSYVVRWSYSITVSGRELSGAPSKHGTTGRNRCAYFFWQGAQSGLGEQGAAALLTVELDKEHGPQVRVVQGSEPAVFLGLFEGQMAVHMGRRGQRLEATDPACRLYMVLAGALAKEARLLEVPVGPRQLRSRSSLLLVEPARSRVFVWHGSQSHEIAKAAALSMARQMHRRAEFGLNKEPKIEEIEEGDEPDDFFKGLGGTHSGLFHSLPPAPSPPEIKMFHFSSASGVFEVQQLLSPARTRQPCQTFPFVQRDLYELSQPALVLVDAGSAMWLWQGWWPELEGGEESAGSAAIRWQAERRAAMQTAVDYWRATRKDIKVNANLVWAGLESLEFTNLFPDWQNRDDAAESNMKDGRKPGDTLSLDDELARLTQSTYPPAQLLQRPLPDGVDPTKLEEYLAPEHFEELLGMCKEKFAELPTWKQTNLKKQVGLF